MGALMVKRRAPMKATRPPSPWAGIEPANRPTPERMRKGDGLRPVNWTEKGEGRATGRVTLVTRGVPIDRAYRDGKLSQRQHDAARWYEQEVRAVTERSPYSRDSLDLTPRGLWNMDDDALTHFVRRKNRLREAMMRLSPYELSVLNSVVVWHEPIGKRQLDRLRFRSLWLALTALANHLGYAEDRK